jgi:hypothetical protein
MRAKRNGFGANRRGLAEGREAMLEDGKVDRQCRIDHIGRELRNLRPGRLDAGTEIS